MKNCTRMCHSFELHLVGIKSEVKLWLPMHLYKLE